MSTKGIFYRQVVNLTASMFLADVLDENRVLISFEGFKLEAISKMVSMQKAAADVILSPAFQRGEASIT